MTQQKAAGAPDAGPDSWPVVWRILLVETDGDSSVIDEMDCEAFARQRAQELREFGWPVRLERVAREPLADEPPSLDAVKHKLRDLKHRTDS